MIMEVVPIPKLKHLPKSPEYLARFMEIVKTPLPKNIRKAAIEASDIIKEFETLVPEERRYKWEYSDEKITSPHYKDILKEVFIGVKDILENFGHYRGAYYPKSKILLIGEYCCYILEELDQLLEPKEIIDLDSLQQGETIHLSLDEDIRVQKTADGKLIIKTEVDYMRTSRLYDLFK